MQKLWDRNFTIITLGTVVSMLGNAISGFAIGLMILDYSGSVFLYALAMVVYNLPKLVMPLLAGVYLDNFSRIKTIYVLDFLSCGLYIFAALVLDCGWFSYPIFLVFSFIIGSIDSTYSVAYDSLYPTLVSEQNFRKAYSISSMLYPISAMMVPVAALAYDSVGLPPLFYFNAVTFFVAAVFETQIRAKETHIRTGQKFTRRVFHEYFIDGVNYIKGEPGLAVITAYFCLNTLAFTGADTVRLPYFKSMPELGVFIYSIVMGAGVFGRLCGGLLHYRINYPPKKRFAIAMAVYIIISLIDGTYLFLPAVGMVILSFLQGITSVTSYNIRISSTQSYVPNGVRARFNGTFQMICTLGGIVGQLLAGWMAELISGRTVVVFFAVLNFIFAVAVMYRGREQVKPIYNQEL